MRQLTIDPPAQATPAQATPAPRPHDESDRTTPAHSRLWSVLEALAYAGALIDPSGALVAQRFRRIQDVRDAR
jgi:hypothetical protein